MGNKQRILACILMALQCSAFGQNPFITSVNKTDAATKEVVTIHGRDFGTDPAVIKVFFGAVRGEIKTIHDHLLQVRVPAGTTFDHISVTNTSSGLTGYSTDPFFLNYRGEPGISAPDFSAQSDFTAQSGLYDLCLCDFNNDNKVDVATASSSSNFITLFQNTSTPGNINLIGSNFRVNARTLHVRCGDLNGDGRPDIVLSEGSDGDDVFILVNNGNFNFTLQSIKLLGIKVKRIAIADLDLDGKPEIVVTNTGGNVVTILPNQSSLSAISFAAPVNITLSQASSTDALEIADLNGDGLPEIVTSQYQADSENKLFICLNKGAFNFNDLQVIVVNKAISNLRIGDLDGDQKPDIAIARLTGSDVSVYLNNSSGSQLSFKQPLFFITESLPAGMDFGDFDGDGKADIAVSTIAKSISVLNNTTASPGTGSFAPVVKLNATYINRNIKNADMDGDGKPDIVFTSVDDFSDIPVPASKISVMRNLSCMVPVVTPNGGALNVCTGTPLRLMATVGGGITYQWFKDGAVTPLKSGAEAFLDITASGEYTVNALSVGCTRISNAVQVTVTPPSTGLTQSTSNARSNSPVCSDNALNLEVNDVGATEYRWSGPRGFSQTVTMPAFSRPNFTLADAGLYVVEMITGTCVAKTDSTLVEGVSVPAFNISFSGKPNFCSGNTKALQLTPRLSSGFAFQWYEKTRGLIPEATFDQYGADASGEYYAMVTSNNAGCLPIETGAVLISALTPPVAAFEAPPSGCKGSEVIFSQQSNTDPGAVTVFRWALGNGDTSGEESPHYAYNGAGTFGVTLTVTYEGVEACLATASKPIEIITPVKPVISATATSLCEGEPIGLTIDGPFTSITWSNSESSATINVTAAGNYSVTTIDDKGCAASDQITLNQKPIPTLSVSADKQAIAAGQTVQLLATGADVYSWSPGKTLNDSTLSNPLAIPVSTTTYIVTGTLSGGCSATGSIAIMVSGEVINIAVPILFSPNGDNINESWIIEGVENYPECSLNVFDKRGGKVFETVGYRNNWDGSIKGTPLPGGVYYYVFGCPNKKALTGTVTVIR